MGESQAEATYEVKEKKRPTLLVDVLTRLVKEKPLGTFGLAIVVILFFTGIFCDVLAPYGMNEIHLADRLVPPCAQYVLGTDNLGRDLLSRIIYGARISMFIGLGATTLDTGLAVLIGVISGYAGGKTDITIQRFVDAWMSFPPMFVYLTVMALLGPGLLQVMFVLGLARGIGSSRVMRSAVIGIKENVYMEAARAIGCPSTRTIMKHVLPNIMAPIIIVFSVAMGGVILQESTLSFLGFGIPPPQPSWGGMLSGPGRQYMYDAPWMAIWPGAALALVVYGMNMLGDAVRDLLDPRLRGGLGRYSGFEKKRAKRARQAAQP